MAELTTDLSIDSSATDQPVRAAWDIAAIASLACGVLLIVPYVAGIAAVALGVIGIRQTSERATRGRRLAQIGAGLGLVNVFGWTFFFYLIAHLSAPGRSIATHFIADLSAARTDDARRFCVPGVAPDRIESASAQIMSWGGAKHIAVLHINEDTAVSGGIDHPSTTTGSIRGDIQTPSGEHFFQLQTINGQINDFSLQ